MALIDLKKVEPHKVSTDLTGYITYIYGQPKTGKTTLAAQMPDALLLAFEKGYNALPGIKAVDITSWAEMSMVYRQLKDPEVKEIYRTVVVDTIDIAAEMCQRYVCDQKGIESLGDLGYGKGWTAFKDEFNTIFRGLTQLGYAVYFIGHAKEQTVKEGDTERVVIRPALSATTRGVIEGMADIYGYAHQSPNSDMSVLTLRSRDDSISCGGRFKYIKSEITLSYENLTATVREAIEKEAAEHNNEFITNEREKEVEKVEYNFDELINEFNNYIPELVNKDPKAPAKITQIVEKYLGKGKKISMATPNQAEMIFLIVQDLKETFNLS